MQKYNKETKKEIRRLAELAHKRELNNALADLKDKFTSWDNDQLDTFQLDHEIYLYHVQTSRAIFRKYNNDSQLDMAVSSAVGRGIIAKEEIEEEVYEMLKPIINRFGGN